MKTLKIALFLATLASTPAAAFADVAAEGHSQPQIASYSNPEGDSQAQVASYREPEGQTPAQVASFGQPEGQTQPQVA